MFELRQIQCFVAVCEELHFGRAAKRLNMTQPPLSRQIQLLEHAVEVQLLERTTRSVTLTPAGKAFLLDANRLLRSAESAVTNVKRASLGGNVPVRLAFTAGASYECLPRLLTRLGSPLPRVETVLRQMTSQEQLESLRAREIDVGLLRLADIEGQLSSEFKVSRVARERMLLALPAKHKLAHGRLPQIAELEGESFIAFSQRDGKYFQRLVGSFFMQAGVTPHYVLQVSQIHSILALVSAGLGISMIPESSRGLHYRGVKLRAAKEHLPVAELHLIRRAERESESVDFLVKAALQSGEARR